MKREFFSLFLLLSLVFSVSAQTQEPRKIDYFRNITCEDLKARLDNWAIEVSKDSKSIGYAIIYEGKYSKYVYDSNGKAKLKPILPVFGESIFRTHLMQKYFSGFGKFPPNKFIFIDGGFRENFEVEFWLVPKGASAPKPTPTLEKMKYRKGTFGNYSCVE